ncbi:uncharacterized protein LOC110443506 [Mizuhopecten yessoensis]|uniref:Short-chain collagen C4 n=1 Tax=Mizuhopecten yessoensis TaxID=6573 RepID=A0A210PER2_MIZYE|nr:uncharacterized protein LOC110443506 [Mizuhopecten yessoensis]OWF34980.1 hypothetical protein KP79_PYT23801 [Mizuhopecten yessoensis]
MESGMFLCIFLFMCGVSATEEHKRVASCDPNYLHDLETKVQTMLTTVSSLTTQLTDQHNAMTQLTRRTTELGSGGMYTRWGRSECSSNSSELVYEGYAGGSHYTDQGAAAEYVCMPRNPVYEYTDYHDYDGYIYGSEYESTFFGTTRVSDDVPCAVCRSLSPSVLMIPGTNTCPAGWGIEYHGILASGYRGHAAASQYVCLDKNPEALPHGIRKEDGKLFYRVRSKCGSLPCPPYIDGSILSCVVCSK